MFWYLHCMSVFTVHCSGWGKQSPDQTSGSQWKRILGIQRFSPGRANQSFLFCFLWNKTSAYCFYKSIRSSAVISSSKSGAETKFLWQNWTGVKKGAVIMATVVSVSECQPAWTLWKILGNNHFISQGNLTTERITTNKNDPSAYKSEF